MAENQKDATSTKCLSAIFQRLLCGGSLPTHPSDQYTKPNGVEFDHSCQKLPFKADENISSSSNKVTANSPGVVARLMGLDSLPEEKNTFVGSFSRSRSVNSLNYLMHFNLTEKFHHRRVRTSVSFREIPNFDQEFKSEFLVFCFNDEEEKKNFSIRKSKMENQEMKPKKVADNSRKNIQKKEKKKVDVAKTSINMSVVGQKKEACGKQDIFANKVKKQVKFEDYPRKMSVQSQVEKKKKNKSKHVVSAKIQPLLNSADSSTKIYHPQQVATHAKGNERKMQLNSRKSQTRVNNQELAITSKVEKQKEINKEADYYVKVLGEICRLTEEELNESYWLATRTGGDFNFEDLCLYFGQEILELLLDQVVHELL